MDIPEDFDQNMMTPGSTQKVGVKSKLFSLITGGIATMPALSINGCLPYRLTDKCMLALKKLCEC